MKKRILAAVLGTAILLATGLGFGNTACAGYTDNIPRIIIKNVKDAPIHLSEVKSIMGRYDYDAPDVAKLGKRIFMLEEAYMKDRVLVSTEDGETFTRKVLSEKFFQKLGLSKKRASDIGIYGIYELNGEINICGWAYSRDQGDYALTVKTRNGKDFYGMKLSKEAPWPDFKLGNRYVQVYTGDEYDTTKIKDKKNKTFTINYKVKVSEDCENWTQTAFSLSGKLSGKDYIYDDTRHRANATVYVGNVWHDEEYAYLEVTYYGNNHKNYDEEIDPDIMWSEEYVYRTRDFEHYEKMDLPGNTFEDRQQHDEDIVSAGASGLFAATHDYVYVSDYYEDGGRLENYTLSRNGEPVFTYHPEKYDGYETEKNYTREWKELVNEKTGTTTLFFEREILDPPDGEWDKKEEYQTAVFISGDGRGDFKEYKSKLSLDKLGKMHTDDAHGYQILERTKFPGEIVYLLFSKDGFAHSFKVKLPRYTKAIELNGDVLVGCSRKNYFSIPLAELYQKME